MLSLAELPTFKIVSIDQLSFSPDNPREDLTRESLTELVSSLQTDGLIQPILVRPRGEKYEVIVGERRVRAAVYANFSKLPALVRDLSDEEAQRLQLIENLQRSDLTVFERAKGIKALMEKYGKTLPAVASLLHKSQGTIRQWLSIAENTSPTIRAIPQYQRKLTTAYLRQLVAYNDATQDKLAEAIIKENLSEKQTLWFIKLFNANPDENLLKLARRTKEELKEERVVLPRQEISKIRKRKDAYAKQIAVQAETAKPKVDLLKKVKPQPTSQVPKDEAKPLDIDTVQMMPIENEIFRQNLSFAEAERARELYRENPIRKPKEILQEVAQEFNVKQKDPFDLKGIRMPYELKLRVEEYMRQKGLLFEEALFDLIEKGLRYAEGR